jgi:chromate reductase
MQLKLLALCGSSRTDSVNGRLLNTAIEFTKTRDVEVTRLDLRELSLPIYDGDLEASSGLPAGCIALKQALLEHQALLIASPEYNGFFTPLLKNAIDWASRPQAGQPSPFTGKVAGLLAASPGALGGMRGLPAVRLLLVNLGVLVTAGQMSLPRAHEAFDAQGKLLDASQQQMLERVLQELLTTAQAMQVQ